MTTKTRIRGMIAALLLTLTALTAGTTPAPAEPDPPPATVSPAGVDLQQMFRVPLSRDRPT